jgi:hypothetical protein
MSAPPLSRVIRFLLIAAGLIIVFSVVWTFIDSSYSDFLAWIARSTAPAGADVVHKGGTIYFAHLELSNGGFRPVSDSIEASAIQFGVLLAVALVAATPGLKIGRRVAFSAIALAITFVLQVLSVMIMARTFNNLFFVIVSDVFPPILWAIFSFRYWFATPRLFPTKTEGDLSSKGTLQKSVPRSPKPSKIQK